MCRGEDVKMYLRRSSADVFYEEPFAGALGKKTFLLASVLHVKEPDRCAVANWRFFACWNFKFSTAKLARSH